MRMSKVMRGRVLDHLLTSSTTPFVTSTAVFLSLHTADPGETGTNAPTTNPWVLLPFNAAASATSVNATIVEVASCPAATISHVGIWDSSATGTATNLFSGEIYGADGSATTKVTNAGDTLRFSSGNLRVRLTS
jgi:hypothetical protein